MPKNTDQTPLMQQIMGKFFQTMNPALVNKNTTDAGNQLVELLEDDEGWREFLTTLGKRTFTGEFSKFHAEFWNWYWHISRLRVQKKALSDETLTFLAGWMRGGGKCLAESTVIQLADGQQKQIKDIEIGDKVCSYTAAQQVTTDVVTNKWDSGIKECYELTLSGGYRLTLTGEHRLLTFNGWKRLDQIDISDRIATPRRILLPQTEVRSNSEVTLLAYMLAEGGTTCGFTFTNSDKVIIDEFYECCTKMGFVPKKTTSKYGYSATGGRKWLAEQGLLGKKAIHKTVPNWVFALPIEQKWLFLAGLFDTDGYIVPNDYIGITLASKKLIEQVHTILLSLGVRSHIRYKPNQYAGSWELRVDGESVLNCAEHLPLKLKKQKLSTLAEVERYSLLDTYPKEVGKNLPSGVNRLLRRELNLQLGSKKYKLTRAKLRRAMTAYSYPLWEQLENADVAWSEIVSIIPVGKVHTYDIETSTHHNFLANNIVSHNSSNVEWACITEGAVGLDGYVLYVSETQASANSHVAEIRQRIESEEVAQAFPHLANPKIGRHGNQYGWKQDFLVTEGGWAIRPVGLDVAVRGLRIGDIRPSMIVFDDIDSHNASAAVRADHLSTIARSIIPAGTKNTLKLIAQNLISEDSIVNQIYTGRTDVLSDHIASVYPAFEDIEIETNIDENGRTKHNIVRASPTWEQMDMEACQRFLNDSGLEAFYSEYQHDFSLDMQDKVIPEYKDYPTHVITWTQFEKKFGTRYHVPPHWQAGMGLDIGYTASHLSAWSWVAVASADSGLPNARFRYRGRTFQGKSIDDQAVEVHKTMQHQLKDGSHFNELSQMVISKMSHEKLGERIVLNRNYGYNFTECAFGKEDGIPQFRNLLRVDYRQPHPFHEDTLDDKTGLYRLGRPNFFDVVEDDQFQVPRDDHGLAIQRAQILNWKRRRVNLTALGIQDSIPMKVDDDTIDSLRMLFAESSLTSTPLTTTQRIERGLREELQKSAVELKLGQEDYPEVLMARIMALKDAKDKENARLDAITASVARVVGNAPQVSPRFRKHRRKVVW